MKEFYSLLCNLSDFNKKLIIFIKWIKKIDHLTPIVFLKDLGWNIFCFFTFIQLFNILLYFGYNFICILVCFKINI